jgi:serine phosphatase RsbU (regulator of sigma subunit)
MPSRGAPDTFRRFIVSMPPRSRTALFLTVFCLFGSFGFLNDIMSGGRHSALHIIFDATFSGGWAALFVAALARYSGNPWRLVLLWTVVGTALSLVLARSFADLPAVELAARPVRLNIDGMATMTAVVIGYASFAALLRREGTRFLRVRTEMDLARDIHRSLAPALRGEAGAFGYEGAAYPSGDVGGDLVDVFPNATADRWVAYIADVSGHGIQSGVVMAMVKSAARMAMRRRSSLEDAFDELNAVLLPLMRPNMFVTAAAVASGREGFRMLVAGHLPILHYHAASGEVTEETVSNLPLGFFADRAYAARDLSCAGGDLLALITDGLVEVFDAEDHELGLGAVKAVLKRTGSLPLDHVLGAIREEALRYGAQVDDQSALLLRIRTA